MSRRTCGAPCPTAGAFSNSKRVGLENKPTHLRNTEDGTIRALKQRLSALCARVEWYEVKLREFVELLQILQPFRIRQYTFLLPMAYTQCNGVAASEPILAPSPGKEYLGELQACNVDHGVKRITRRFLPLGRKSGL